MSIYECLHHPGHSRNGCVTMLLLLIHGIDVNQFIEVKGSMLTNFKSEVVVRNVPEALVPSNTMNVC